MNAVVLFAAQQIAAFGINKGLKEIFHNREDFSSRLYKIISKTIDEFQKTNPNPDQGKSFSFYKSQVLIEEFLKFRLFSNKGYKLNVNKIQNALERNPNILKPTQQDIELFIQVFDKFVNTDEKLKQLEIEEFHKEAIFEIYDKVERILDFLEIHLVEIIPLLEEEYKEEINSCVEEIKDLKPNTALKQLSNLDERVNRNSEHVSKKLQASLLYFKGICFEALDLSKEAYEHFIKAYKLTPKNNQYLEKACISYYFLKNDKYKDLKSKIESKNDFSVYCWAIDTMESDNTINFIKENLVQNVLDNNHYKRIVFNNNLKVNKVDTLDLIDVLEVVKISNEIPDTINYDNLHHWIFILNTLSIQFFNSCAIPFWGFLKKDERSIQILELSKILADEIKRSELDNSYNAIVFNYYWLQSEIEIKSDTIINLKKAYESLKEKDSFRTMLIANSLQKHEGIEIATKIIEEYEGDLDENLFSLKTFCQLDNPKTKDTVIEYFNYLNIVDKLNVQNFCNYLIPIIKSSLIKKEELINLVEEVSFSESKYKKLAILIIDTFYYSEQIIENERINELANKFKEHNKLYYLIAVLYFENEYFDNCIQFLDKYINEEKESQELFLYIRALDSSSKASQLKLLRLLKRWRTLFTYNDYLLRIEIELQQILKDWNEIYSITKYALSQMPEDEAFYTLYLISLTQTDKSSYIKNEIEKIKNFNFQVTENALRVVNILIQSDYIVEGIELLYLKACNRNDSLARMNYFFLTSSIPEEYLKELKIVVENSYVKFEIDGEVDTILIDSKAISSPVVQKSIGKSVNDTFAIDNPITRKIRQVKILRIMNKYLALGDDIITEANSSFSSLPVASVKFESSDKEGIEKTMIENFGAAQEQRRKTTEKNFNDYYNFKLSFTELVNGNFDGSFIDAYYHMTSNQSDGYLIKPLKYFSSKIGFEDKKIVIDFTSGLLLYELSERLGLSYDKFYVSGNIYPLFDNLILKTESQRESKLSITVTDNKVIPHFYSEDFHDNRIGFLKKLKKWFIENSDSEIPKEKIELIRPLYKDGKMSNWFEYIIDNAFFAQRKSYILLSDDIGYENMLKVNNWATTEKYLLKAFPEKKNEIIETMLSLRYIGISINSEILYSTYINHYKEGYNHIYNYALRNFSLPVNFSSFNIFIAVDFLKKVALNPIITHEKYKLDATRLFSMLISSFPNPTFGFTLKNRIEQQFCLLGDYLDLTLSSLINALEINNLTN